jgi:hypothetical protein
MAKGINQKSAKNNNDPELIRIPSAIPDIISSIAPGLINDSIIEADIATARKIHSTVIFIFKSKVSINDHLLFLSPFYLTYSK